MLTRLSLGKKMVDAVKDAMRTGKSILIENIENTIDAVL